MDVLEDEREVFSREKKELSYNTMPPFG